MVQETRTHNKDTWNMKEGSTIWTHGTMKPQHEHAHGTMKHGPTKWTHGPIKKGPIIWTHGLT